MSATPSDAYHTSEAISREERPEGFVARSRLLDKPSEPHPILGLLMSEALTSINLISDGAVMALRERTTGTKTPNAPTSDLAKIIGQLEERYAKCKTHRARIMVIKDAQALAARLKYAPKAEQRGTREWKEAIGGDERSCRIVASVYAISLRDVVAYRKAFRVTKVAK